MAPVTRDTSRVLGWSIALALTAVFVSLGIGTAVLYQVFHTTIWDILGLYGGGH